MSDAERVRKIYNRCASNYDRATRRLDPMRARLFARARGDVLELGVGTGATFTHYPSDLHSLTGLDISEKMLAQAEEKAKTLPFPVELRIADFQTLPFDDGSFDTVVSSLALCGIPSPALLFAEVKRVLRPGGQLLALEHIRPPNPLLGLAASAVNPLFHRFVGCYLNRRTPDLLRAAGFRVTIWERRILGGLVAITATLET